MHLGGVWRFGIRKGHESYVQMKIFEKWINLFRHWHFFHLRMLFLLSMFLLSSSSSPLPSASSSPPSQTLHHVKGGDTC